MVNSLDPDQQSVFTLFALICLSENLGLLQHFVLCLYHLDGASVWRPRVS